ncbi:MAG: polysaccharide deacetylase family protein [Candidatus Hodarchaeota archaeon]
MPITAKILKRHCNILKPFAKRGVEFAIHGYVHTDFSHLSSDEQYNSFLRALEIFDKCEIKSTGFRNPYLRGNSGTYLAAKKMGFRWSSNKVISWNVLEEKNFPKRKWNNYKRALEFVYNYWDSEECLPIPETNDNLVEIPISMPDDEMLVDRLGITNRERLKEPWKQILIRAHQSGGLFVLQLHHERIPYCLPAVSFLLEKANSFEPKIWTASLGEIAEWWKEKNSYEFAYETSKGKEYNINIKGSRKSYLVFNNIKINPDNDVEPFINGYNIMPLKNLRIPINPVIGVHPAAPIELINYLRDDGFLYEISLFKDRYIIYLDGFQNFESRQRKDLLKFIETSGYPILRVWRWPDKAASCLAITGDIDCLTLGDIIKRIFEF